MPIQIPKKRISPNQCLSLATLAALTSVYVSAGCDAGDDGLAAPVSSAEARATNPQNTWTRWLPFRTNPQGASSPTFVEVEPARNLDGTLAVFAKSSGGEIFYSQERQPGRDWTPFQSIGGHDLRKFRVATNADGRLEVFAFGGDGVLYHEWQSSPNSSSFAPWFPEGSRGNRDFDVVLNKDGRLEVVVLSTTGALSRIAQLGPNQTFGNWESFSSGNGLGLRSISLAREGNGSLVLMGLDAYGEAMVTRQPHVGQWTAGFTSADGTALQSVQLVTNADGRVDALALGGNGVVYAQPQGANNVGWAGWRLAASAGTITTLDVANSFGGHADVVAVDNQGHAQYLRQRGSGASDAWYFWGGMGGPDLRSVKLVTRGRDDHPDEQTLAVFALDSRGYVYWTYQTPSGRWLELSQPPGARSFTFSPGVVGRGGSSKAQWDFEVAADCTPRLTMITPTNDRFDIPPSGAIDIALPNREGDYFARIVSTCLEHVISGNPREYNFDAPVSVRDGVTTIDVSVDRDYINQGESTTVRWSSAVPSDCVSPSVTLRGDRDDIFLHDVLFVEPGRASSGSRQVTPPWGAVFTAELHCGSAIVATDKASVGVHIEPPPPPEPKFWCMGTKPGSCFPPEPYYEDDAQAALDHCQFNNPAYQVSLVPRGTLCPLNP
jgi:hypothetical protein